MRILHVIGSLAPRYGGPSLALPSMCKALAARGHDVEVMTTNIDGPNELPVPLGQPLTADGFTTTHFPVQRPRSYAMSLPLGRGLRSRVGDFDGDEAQVIRGALETLALDEMRSILIEVSSRTKAEVVRLLEGQNLRLTSAAALSSSGLENLVFESLSARALPPRPPRPSELHTHAHFGRRA